MPSYRYRHLDKNNRTTVLNVTIFSTAKHPRLVCIVLQCTVVVIKFTEPHSHKHQCFCVHAPDQQCTPNKDRKPFGILKKPFTLKYVRVRLHSFGLNGVGHSHSLGGPPPHNDKHHSTLATTRPDCTHRIRRRSSTFHCRWHGASDDNAPLRYRRRCLCLIKIVWLKCKRAGWRASACTHSGVSARREGYAHN